VSLVPPVEPVPLVPVELPVLEGVEDVDPKLLLELDDGVSLVVEVAAGVELEELDVLELPKSLVVEDPLVELDDGVLLLSNDDDPDVPEVEVLPNELEPEDGVVE
jgi:hypothetical protein